MKICPKCQMPGVIESDEFCHSDGEKLVEQIKHSCGRNLRSSDKFCPRCGMDLIWLAFGNPTKNTLRLKR